MKKICLLSGVACLLLSACSTPQTILKSDGTLKGPHITALNQKVTAAKIGQNLLTGSYELIGGHIETTILFVPILVNSNATGVVTGVVTPDATFESALYGRAGVFGAAGGELRVSTGVNGVGTHLGGDAPTTAPAAPPGYNIVPGAYSAAPAVPAAAPAK